MSPLQRLVPPLILTLTLLVIWELACRLLEVPTYFLPPPSAVALGGGRK